MINSDAEKEIPDVAVKSKTALKKIIKVSRVSLQLILIFGLVGIVYFSWQQQNSIVNLQNSQSQLTLTTENINNRIILFEQNIESINDANASAELLLNQQNSRLDSLNEELVSLRLGINVSQSNGVWQVAEAASLLRLAQQYLQLNQDALVALSLYRSSYALLIQIDDSAIDRIRAMLASDIQVLSRQVSVDIQGLFMRLSDLSQQLDRISLIKDIEPSLDFTDRNSEENVRQGFLARAGIILSQYFTVRRIDTPVQMPFNNTEVSFLRQNMQLQLEQAKLALLQKRPGIYQDSISNVLMLAQQNIPEEDPFKTNVIRDLRGLQTATISLNLPRLSDSLSQLEALLLDFNAGAGI